MVRHGPNKYQKVDVFNVCRSMFVVQYISSIAATLIIWKGQRNVQKPYPKKNRSKGPIVQRCTNDQIPTLVNQKLSPSHQWGFRPSPVMVGKNGRQLHGRLRLRPGPGWTRETTTFEECFLKVTNLHGLDFQKRDIYYIYFIIYNI